LCNKPAPSDTRAPTGSSAPRVESVGVTDQDAQLFLHDVVEPARELDVHATQPSRTANEYRFHALLLVRVAARGGLIPTTRILTIILPIKAFFRSHAEGHHARDHPQASLAGPAVQ
jgi:hypothetical protein